MLDLSYLIEEFQTKKIRELEQGFQKDLDEVKVEFDEERYANEHGHCQQYYSDPFIYISMHTYAHTNTKEEDD